MQYILKVKRKSGIWNTAFVYTVLEALWQMMWCVSERLSHFVLFFSIAVPGDNLTQLLSLKVLWCPCVPPCTAHLYMQGLSVQWPQHSAPTIITCILLHLLMALFGMNLSMCLSNRKEIIGFINTFNRVAAAWQCSRVSRHFYFASAVHVCEAWLTLRLALLLPSENTYKVTVFL